MAKRALREGGVSAMGKGNRLWRAAIIAGTSYLVAIAAGIEGIAGIAWKGAGVALLAAAAWLSAREAAHRWISAVMAFGAAGDILLETHGLTAGAAAFAIGHLLAMTCYWQHRRADPVATQKALAAVLLVAAPAIGWVLTRRADVAFYALLLGGMAASAWLSRFSRYSVGIGAVLFLLSDLLIFARMGPLAGAVWVSLAIWALYFAGQYLIATGVVLGRGSAARLP